MNQDMKTIDHSTEGPGGVLRFELDRGVPLEPQNPTHL